MKSSAVNCSSTKSFDQDCSRYITTSKDQASKGPKKDLKPIALTACLSKVAEGCKVSDHVKPAVLKVLDANQYGTVPNSSTRVLIDMVHCWAR